MKKVRYCAIAFALMSVFVVVGASGAHAATTVKSIPTLCKYPVEGGGGATADLPPATSTITTNAPTEVDAGTKFNVNMAIKTVGDDPLPFEIDVDNVTITFDVTGGATPTSFQLHIAHSVAPPNGGFDFGSFNQQLTAPSKAGSVKLKIKTVHIDKVTLGASEFTDVACTGPDGFDLTVVTLAVAPPPPPGAPNAKADEAGTTPSTPVTVDVLKNDVPSDIGPIDVSSLAVVEQGTKGSAKVVDGKVVYSPNAGATGVDTLRYRVCTDASAATTTTSTTTEQIQSVHAAATSLCDETTVTITINAPQQHLSGSVATTTTTVAARALPRTGSATGPGLAAGASALVAGGALLWTTRRRAGGARGGRPGRRRRTT